jgi:predicted transposase YdaD
MLKTVVGPERAEELKMNILDEHFERGRQQGVAQGKIEGKVEGKIEGKVEGIAEGKAGALLQLLSARGVPIDDASRQRIMSCRDIATLDLWFSRALKATHLSEVLEALAQ